MNIINSIIVMQLFHLLIVIVLGNIVAEKLIFDSEGELNTEKGEDVQSYNESCSNGCCPG